MINLSLNAAPMPASLTLASSLSDLGFLDPKMTFLPAT
jgi:hypothetical protein